jgi:hypothetical protein
VTDRSQTDRAIVSQQIDREREIGGERDRDREAEIDIDREIEKQR